MGIWIRSQDKEILAECNVLKLKYTSVNNIFYIYADSKGEKVYLGGYSTKEKALKVLDMIETHLEELEYKIHDREVVFKMPHDNEVIE